MTAASQLQDKIRSTIPLSVAMDFSITELSLDQIRVQAPLEPNVNIHGTGFAGSLYAVAVLTGWALTTHIMESLRIPGELVVAGAEIRYRKPVTGDLVCRCHSDEEARTAFLQAVQSNGKGRMELQIEVGEAAAVLNAAYVAVVR